MEGLIMREPLHLAYSFYFIYIFSHADILIDFNIQPWEAKSIII